MIIDYDRTFSHSLLASSADAHRRWSPIILRQAYCFGTAGEHLTRNLRHAMMKKLMTMDVGYFDHSENSAGELTMFLAEKARLDLT
jgi:hypothetical protein